MRVRGAPAGREHRPPGSVPLVTSGMRTLAQERERSQGQSGGRLSQGQFQRAVQTPGEQPILATQSPQAPGPMAEGTLCGSRKASRKTAGRRGEVQSTPEIPVAAHHMGRRGDQLLF